VTGRRRGLEHDVPAPHSRRQRLLLWLAVLGGPLAWLVQLNASYGLLSQPCYPGPERYPVLPDHAAWVWPVAIVLYLACLAIAFASTTAAVIVLRRARAGDADGKDSRDCFIGYAGILLGGGFTAVILANLVVMIGVPACVL
jgi:hypothetical protein